MSEPRVSQQRVSDERLEIACEYAGHGVHMLTPTEKCLLALEVRDARSKERFRTESIAEAEMDQRAVVYEMGCRVCEERHLYDCISRLRARCEALEKALRECVDGFEYGTVCADYCGDNQGACNCERGRTIASARAILAAGKVGDE